MVAAEAVSQRFGATLVLWPLDLEMAPGERLAVLGGNGAGKTTLLRMLATLARPASGSLKLFGLDAAVQRSSIRPRLGHLGHQAGLYPALRAIENLRLFCRLHGLPAVRADEALAEAGLEGQGQRATAELSRGEQQRLAIARTLLHDPELWILDEPDASLDIEGRARLDRMAEGRTLVVATHDQGLARRLCSRSLYLREGRAEEPPRLELLEGG